MGRHTITGMLTANGSQFRDWTSTYRLFNQGRIDTSEIFKNIIGTITKEETKPNKAVYGLLDDTLLKKTGKKVSGTAWRRDPLGPRFRTNLIWGQRFIQTSIAIPEKDGASRSRAIPVDFYHAPTAKKPKKNSPDQEWKEYNETQKRTKLSQAGIERIEHLRHQLDCHGAKDRTLIMNVDGSYTNETVFKNLPDRVILTGRIRKDAAFYSIPDTSKKGVGRNRVYGDRLPTPEQIRQSDDYPWEQVRAWGAGKVHEFDVKVVREVRWKKAGKQDLTVIVIRPLAYRKTKKSKIMYRDPVYLICTSTEIDIEEILQAYLWRWEIEVNFRDEKTIMGCGQTQVVKSKAVERAPAFIVGVYALMLLAAIRSTRCNGNKNMLPRAKWNKPDENDRQSTMEIVNMFRTQYWARSINLNFDHFVANQYELQSGGFLVNPLISACFYQQT